MAEVNPTTHLIDLPSQATVSGGHRTDDHERGVHAGSGSDRSGAVPAMHCGLQGWQLPAGRSELPPSRQNGKGRA